MNFRILICDDHDLMRRGMRTLLEAQPGWTVSGEAHTGREAIDLAARLRPDIAILDVTMPDLNGLEAAKRIKKVSSQTKILMLSAHCSNELVRRVMDAGVRGYVVKTASDRDLVKGVQTIANGKPFFSPEAQAAMIQEATEHPEVEAEPLTTREREIVQLLAEGKSSKEVASDLNLSTKTVETHRSNIMRKLNAHKVSDLVLFALRNRMIEA